MGTRNFLVLKTLLEFLHKSLLDRAMHGNMFGVIGSIWVFVWGYVFFLLGFITRFILRLQGDNQQIKSADIDDEFIEKEAGFHVQKDENEEESNKDSDVVMEKTALASSTNKYKFFSGKDVNGFLEEPKALSFTIQELYMGSNEFSAPDIQIFETQVSSDQDFPGKFSEGVVDLEDKGNDVVNGFCTGEALEKRQENEVSDLGEDEDPVLESSSSEEEVFHDPKQGNFPETELFPENSFGFSNGVESFSENYALASDAEPVPTILSDGSSRKDQDVDSITYEFSRESDGKDVSEGLKPETPPPAPAIDEGNGEGTAFSADHHNDSEDEYIELEPHKHSTQTSFESKYYFEEKHQEEEEEEKNSENDLDFVWEHGDVIEQLKWELKNARTGGLPTIYEEESDSESPKVEDNNINFKPMKIDLKFGYKDRMEEIQKVYRTYAEKMRKLDILNNQTMHAVGFMQLKDQGTKSKQPVQKASVPIVKSLLARKRLTAIAADPILKYAVTLHKDFELVYVGQVCLSWEILHWQQRKVQELLQYDDVKGSRQYNLVASEFQLFQVLLQRFVEDESFQGPRIQNYVKNRCVIRSLLQVPAIRDDSMKDKQYGMEGNGDSILCENLANIVVEAMFTFWGFLRKDDKIILNQRVGQKTVTDPADSKLLIEIWKDFHKKERKVKDIQRSGNCVVKKLQKHQEEGRLQHALFMAQVELRLISRVLNLVTVGWEYRNG
ncbi:Ribosomal protein [Trema orientale]|uniref:Ribosomal protein n=1 Tax=Trema orientale TaxID=63057 RepID=A0A2P5D184_TREOI|nr:Ribosomal protein [Trema orientale]